MTSNTALDANDEPRMGVSTEDARTGERSRSPLSYLPLAAVLVLAVGFRIWRLGHWGLEGDEIHTLRDSLNPSVSNPRPLIYLLNYYLVRPLVPLDELGLRVLPALFGILAVPAMYFVTRALVGVRAAGFASLLLTCNPYQVYLSQYGRYWSCVFLLSSIYPFAIYLGVRDRHRGALVLGVLTAMLAVIAHPVAILPAGGAVLFYAQQLRRDQVARLWRRRSVRVLAVGGGIAAIALAIRFVSILHGWIVLRPQNWVREHLLLRPQGVSKQFALLLGYVDGLTMPLALVGALGVYLLWRGRDRPLGLFLMWVFAVPVAVLLLLSFRTALAGTYLVPSQPVFYIGAGVFLDRLTRVDWELRPRWLLPATVTALIITAGLPTLLSQYRNGRRNDFRGAARWLQQHLGPRDVVFSDQFHVLTHYLPGARVQALSGDPGPVRDSLRSVGGSGEGAAIWLVAPAASHALRSYADEGDLVSWIYGNCQLRNTVGAGRLDFRHQYLQIYRCPPILEEGAGAVQTQGESAGARGSRLRANTSR